MINEVLDVMINLAKDGMTMMAFTMRWALARKVADRVVFMDAGEIVKKLLRKSFSSHRAAKELSASYAKILQH